MTKDSDVDVFRNVIPPESRKRDQVPSEVVVELTVVEPFVFQASPMVLEPDFPDTGPAPPVQSYDHISTGCHPLCVVDIVLWRTPSL